MTAPYDRYRSLRVVRHDDGVLEIVMTCKPGQKLPKGQLDGIEALPGGDYLVSSWEGSAVYRGKPGGEWKPVAEGVKAPADIGVDSKRGWLLIPLFTENMVHTAAIAP